MSGVPRVQIPTRHYQAFSTLLGMSHDQFKALEAALHGAETTFSARDLATLIGASLAIEAQQANDIVEMLVSLYDLRGELEVSVSDMVTALITALGLARDEDLHPTDETKSDIETRLADALSIGDPLRTIAKAVNLQGEYQHSYIGAHIATDMRPVFQDDLDAPLAAALIAHTLKLTYAHDNRQKEFFITLTSGDIDELKLVLDRAEQKGKSLEAVLQSANVPLLREVE